MRKNVKLQRSVIVVAICIVLLLAIVAVWGLAYEPWSKRQKYPLKYSEEISVASQEFGLDPYLITAMVFCESSFRVDIVSHADAVGLMQVTPETGAWIAPKLSIADFDEEMLKDPAINTRMGCWYVDFLMDRYDQEVVPALTGYIAGQGTVDRLLQDERYSPDGKTLDLTGYEGRDTREYAKKILGVREVYLELYPDVYKNQ